MKNLCDICGFYINEKNSNQDFCSNDCEYEFRHEQDNAITSKFKYGTIKDGIEDKLQQIKDVLDGIELQEEKVQLCFLRGISKILGQTQRLVNKELL